MYGKQLFTLLNKKRMRAGGLITAMVQQLLRIRPFADSGLAWLTRTVACTIVTCSRQGISYLTLRAVYKEHSLW